MASLNKIFFLSAAFLAACSGGGLRLTCESKGERYVYRSANAIEYKFDVLRSGMIEMTLSENGVIVSDPIRFEMSEGDFKYYPGIAIISSDIFLSSNSYNEFMSCVNYRVSDVSSDKIATIWCRMYGNDLENRIVFSKSKGILEFSIPLSSGDRNVFKLISKKGLAAPC